MLKTPSRAMITFTLGSMLLVVGTIFAEKLTPTAEEQKSAQVVCQLIHRFHISRRKIDDEISAAMLKRYLQVLDPQKAYFTQADIDEFEKSRLLLDDQIIKGDLTFAFKAFDRYLVRLDQRVATARKWVRAKHDFTLDEELVIDRDTLKWPADKAQADERWRKRIKYQLLTKKLDDTPLDEARDQLLKRYTSLSVTEHQTEASEVLQKYLSSLTHCFDPHSSYMSPQSREDFDIAMSLRLQGIGAALRNEDGYTVVAQIVPGGAAAKDARLKVNDKIIGVAQGDGDIVDIVEMKLSRVVRLIRGKKGTVVRLQVKVADSGETKIYEMTRQLIELKQQEVRSEVIQAGKRIDGRKGRVGVISVPSFYRDFEGERRGVPDFKSASRDVKTALEKFRGEPGVDAVVIDLRLNGGGALKDAIEVSGLFIDQGPVVRVKELDGSITPHDDPEAGEHYTGPLVIICSRMSASASEIFAGVIKDYRRGLIVGDRTTHGKGTVQNVMPVASSPIVQFFSRRRPGALKLTIQQFYRVNGDSSQERGIPSDITLPSVIDHMDFDESSLENHLPFSRIEPAEFKPLALVNPRIVSRLQANSSRRLKNNVEFGKDRKAIERYLARKDRKSVSLNEAVLKKEIDEGKSDDETKPEVDPNQRPPVFRDDHYNDEVLQITLDYVELLKRSRTARN